jgi:hypothetical protein
MSERKPCPLCGRSSLIDAMMDLRGKQVCRSCLLSDPQVVAEGNARLAVQRESDRKELALRRAAPDMLKLLKQLQSGVGIIESMSFLEEMDRVIASAEGRL